MPDPEVAAELFQDFMLAVATTKLTTAICYPRDGYGVQADGLMMMQDRRDEARAAEENTATDTGLTRSTEKTPVASPGSGKGRDAWVAQDHFARMLRRHASTWYSVMVLM